MFTVALVTVSDRCSRGEARDTAGPAVAAFFCDAGFPSPPGASIVVVPDEAARIETAILAACEKADLVLTIGGTGFSPRDITPEVTARIIHRFAPGIAELLRSKGAEHTSASYLSRGVAGIRGRTLVVNFPGSEKAALESAAVLLPVLPHALAVLTTENPHGTLIARGDSSACLPEPNGATAEGGAQFSASPPASDLSHLTPTGELHLVDVGGKARTRRVAVAAGRVVMREATLRKALAGNLPKGDVFSAARLAAITAAKNTAAIIPLCHSLPLDHVAVTLTPISADNDSVDCAAAIRAEVTVSATWRTGVEMEALCAVSAACLCIYDMCKALEKGMVIEAVRLLSKTGGKSGDYSVL